MSHPTSDQHARPDIGTSLIGETIDCVVEAPWLILDQLAYLRRSARRTPIVSFLARCWDLVRRGNH